MPNDVDATAVKILSALHRLRERLSAEVGTYPPDSGRSADLCRKAVAVNAAARELSRAIPSTIVNPGPEKKGPESRRPPGPGGADRRTKCAKKIAPPWRMRKRPAPESSRSRHSRVRTRGRNACGRSLGRIRSWLSRSSFRCESSRPRGRKTPQSLKGSLRSSPRREECDCDHNLQAGRIFRDVAPGRAIGEAAGLCYPPPRFSSRARGRSDLRKAKCPRAGFLSPLTPAREKRPCLTV